MLRPTLPTGGLILSQDLPASAESEPQFTPAKMNILSLILGFAGFCASLYALALHLKSKTGTAALSCDVNDLVSCTKVLGGEYGEFIGIPLGALGMAYFGIVMSTALLPKLSECSETWIAKWRFFVAIMGVVVVAALGYLSYVKIGAVCVVCSSVHAITLLNFGVVFISWLKNRKGLNMAHPSAFLKLMSISLALSVPPIIAGVILPSLAPTLFSVAGKNIDEASGAPKAPAPNTTPVPAETLTFSKSNFVGNGEDYRKGNDNARVVMFMYSDFGCPHCKHASEAIDAALSIVGPDKVLFVYRNYPLSNHCNASIGAEGHKYSCEQAMAARSAGQQGKFWKYKEWVLENIEASDSAKEKLFTNDGFISQAEKMGLDKPRFQQCLTSKLEMAKIKEDIEFGKKLGIQGTPLLILGGKPYTGPQTPEAFAGAFQALLAK